ncbi:MAG: GAF domain-containing sensor histidine kinase [Patescibacteria group bacterium]
MNFSLLLTYVSSFFILASGVFVFFNGRRLYKNISFLVMTVLFFLTNIINYYSYISSTKLTTLLFIRITAFLFFSIVLVIYLFSRSFSREYIDKKEIKIILYFLIYDILFGLLIFSPLTFSGVHLHPTVSPTVNIGIFFFLIANIANIALTIKSFYIQYKNSFNKDKAQLKYIIYGFSFFLIIALIFNVIFPIFLHNTDFSILLANIYIIFIFLLISYAIVRQRLFNITVAIRNILIYIISFILLVLFDFLINYVLNFQLTPIELFIEILFSTLIVIIFPLFHELSQQILDKIVFKRISNIRGEIDHLLESINTNIDIDKFFSIFRESIEKIFGVSKMAFVIVSSDSSLDIHSVGIDDKLIQDKFSVFSKLDNILLLSESEDENFEELILEDVDLILPIKSGNNILCLILLGKKKSGDPYYTNDVKILLQLRVQIAIFITNLRLYKEVLNFNNELEGKVKEATIELNKKNTELKKANEDLASLDKLKDDLLSIASHELRTPATIVKGNAYMAKDLVDELKIKLKGKEYRDDMERLDRYTSRTVESIENEIRIVNTLLEASRLGKTDITILPEYIDISSMVESQLIGFGRDAESKGLKIEYKDRGIKHQVFADKTRIEEVLGNLISNAIKYSEKGTIVISTEENNKELTVHIKDQGIGIASDDIPNLFQKFHRLNNYTGDPNDPRYLLVRPGGTGLGLYVVKGIIEKHGGRVWVDSKEGKGSTFSFTLPLSKGKQAQKQDETKDMFKKLGLKRD